MFNNNLTNLEKKAIIMTLGYLNPNSSIQSYTSIYNKKLYKKIKIENTKTKSIIEFNIDNYFKCDDILKNMLYEVFDEYNFVPHKITSQIDILQNLSLLCNGISRLLVENLSIISTTDNFSNTLATDLQNISDKCTLRIISNKLSNHEKTCLVIVRHLIDNILTGQLFSDGIDLLDFINGTRIIKDILCLNATLYDENTYFRFYQENN